MGSAVKIDTLKVAFFCLQTTISISLGYPASAGFVFDWVMRQETTKTPSQGLSLFTCVSMSLYLRSHWLNQLINA
jgi:hypothetical protein